MGYFSSEGNTIFNAGYSDWYIADGIFLQGHARNQIDRYRLQLYEHMANNLGQIDSMEGKTLLEAGCGRGGGLKHMVERFKPKLAIGVDFNRS